jgi:hypothetical protein
LAERERDYRFAAASVDLFQRIDAILMNLIWACWQGVRLRQKACFFDQPRSRRHRPLLEPIELSVFVPYPAEETLGDVICLLISCRDDLINQHRQLGVAPQPDTIEPHMLAAWV